MLRAGVALYLLGLSTAAAAAAPSPVGGRARRPQLGITQQRSIVFAPGDCDTTGECYPFFRIPAIKRAKSGALLAFAEARGGDAPAMLPLAASSAAGLNLQAPW